MSYYLTIPIAVIICLKISGNIKFKAIVNGINKNAINTSKRNLRLLFCRKNVRNFITISLALTLFMF